MSDRGPTPFSRGASRPQSNFRAPPFRLLRSQGVRVGWGSGWFPCSGLVDDRGLDAPDGLAWKATRSGFERKQRRALGHAVLLHEASHVDAGESTTRRRARTKRVFPVEKWNMARLDPIPPQAPQAVREGGNAYEMGDANEWLCFEHDYARARCGASGGGGSSRWRTAENGYGLERSGWPTAPPCKDRQT
jgi:hypothetical protein